MPLPKVRVCTAPSSARLLLSLPQEVKYSSRLLQPSVRATAARAAFRASSLRAPGPYRLDHKIIQLVTLEGMKSLIIMFLVDF